MTATREKAEAELLRYHPDFEDIRETDDFHNWVNEQPQSIQDALYENASDARTAARAIDLYKADKNITTKKKTKTTDKDAARSVNARNSRSKPDTSDSSKAILESDVQKMSAQEYEKMSDDIMEAIRTGTFVYDISGNAR